MTTFDDLIAAARAELVNGAPGNALAPALDALGLQPENVNALGLYGVALHRANDKSAALPYLRKAAAQAPRHQQILAALADSCMATGAFDEAVAVYQTLCEVLPDSLEAWAGAAAALAACGKLPEAIEASETMTRRAGHLRAMQKVRAALSQNKRPVILDVGANSGQMSMRYATWFPEAVIHAFEPDPNAYKKLTENLGGKARTVNAAVGARCGSMRFNVASDSACSSLLAINTASSYVRHMGVETLEAREVEVITIDDYCLRNNIEFVDFIKIDTQGNEVDVLSGCKSLLSRKAIKLIQCEIIFRKFYENASSFGKVEQQMEDYGYSLLCLFDIYPSQGSNIFQADALYCLEN